MANDEFQQSWKYCNHTIANYFVIPGETFGKLPKNMHETYTNARCFRFFCRPQLQTEINHKLCELKRRDELRQQKLAFKILNKEKEFCRRKDVFINHRMPVFWINMDESKERRDHFSFQLKQLGFRHKRIPAYTPQTMPLDTIYQIISSSEESSEELSCLFSHLRAIYEAVYDSSLCPCCEFAMVMEDDVSFKMDVDFLALVRHAPRDFAILQLMTSAANAVEFNWEQYKQEAYTIAGGPQREQAFPPLFTPWSYQNATWSTQVYLINKRNVKRQIDFIVHPPKENIQSFPQTASPSPSPSPSPQSFLSIYSSLFSSLFSRPKVHSSEFSIKSPIHPSYSFSLINPVPHLIKCPSNFSIASASAFSLTAHDLEPLKGLLDEVYSSSANPDPPLQTGDQDQVNQLTVQSVPNLNSLFLLPCQLPFRIVADMYLYSSLKPTYTIRIPIFNGRITNISRIHSDHVSAHNHQFKLIEDLLAEAQGMYGAHVRVHEGANGDPVKSIPLVSLIPLAIRAFNCSLNTV